MNLSVGLIRALRHMLPDARIAVVHERPWHSLTFTGAQICISATLQCNDHAAMAESFERMLAAYEFDVRGQLVADIAVIERVDGQSETRLLVAALVLED